MSKQKPGSPDSRGLLSKARPLCCAGRLSAWRVLCGRLHHREDRKSGLSGAVGGGGIEWCAKRWVRVVREEMGFRARGISSFSFFVGFQALFLCIKTSDADSFFQVVSQAHRYTF